MTTSGAVTQLSIAAAPALYPEFDPAVSDYVTRCGSNPVSISVAAPPGTNVAIDGGPAQGGVFNRNVALTAGRAFEFSTTTGRPNGDLPRALPASRFSRLDLQQLQRGEGELLHHDATERHRARRTAGRPLRGDLRRARCAGLVATLGRY